MTHYSTLPTQFFRKVVIGRPKRVIVFILAVVSFLAYNAKDFKLDASAETLVLQNDKDLQYS
ncbi:MAG TPA: hypothetical protein VMW95_03170, partial [Desulfobacterales bacterium]|nr:hypothetical protein [Desulfobacterales bacterium]